MLNTSNYQWIDPFYLARALLRKTDLSANRDNFSGFVYFQTWRIRFKDGIKQILLQWHVSYYVKKYKAVL